MLWNIQNIVEYSKNSEILQMKSLSYFIERHISLYAVILSAVADLQLRKMDENNWLIV